MKERAEKEMKTPLGGGKQHGADNLSQSRLYPALHYAQRGDVKAWQGTVETVVTNHCALMAEEADTRTPAHNTSGFAPGRALIILSVSNGLWQSVW